MKTRLALIIFSACLLFFGCGRGGGIRENVVSTRWIKTDSVLFYTTHRYGWSSTTNRLFTSPRTSEIDWSDFRMFLVDVIQDSLGPRFGVPRLVHEIKQTVPCNGVDFDTLTTRMIVSYLALDRAKPADCPRTGPSNSLRVMVGQVADSQFVETIGPFDKIEALQRVQSPEARAHSANVYSGYKICLGEEGACLSILDY